MAFTLGSIVPWGRPFDEYVAMFALTEADLARRMLGCGDGPAGFNAALTRRGGSVVSVDPIYAYPADAIASRIEDTRVKIMAQTRTNADQFVWDYFGTPDVLERVRLEAMGEFLRDYPRGVAEGRYRVAELPQLPFAAQEFELALCSHLLFLYSEALSLEFHVRSIHELVRVAHEVRIFPLLELGSRRSRHLDRVLEMLSEAGLSVSVERVRYEFQKGGNEMLRVGSGARHHA